MNDKLMEYMRYNPSWHVIVSRYPNRIKELESIYKEENNLTFVSKLERVSMIISMMEMML